jgi:hypothetical protein
MVIDWTEEVKRRIKRQDCLRQPIVKEIYDLAMRLVESLEVTDQDFPLPTVSRLDGCGLGLAWSTEHARISVMIPHACGFALAIQKANYPVVKLIISDNTATDQIRTALGHLVPATATSDEILKSIGYH